MARRTSSAGRNLESLKELDAVVIDLQDAGVRFYTYETVVGYFLEAAAQAHIEIILLDRPNPIGGVAVQGPVSDDGAESYNELHAAAGSPRHDARRTGALLQQRASASQPQLRPTSRLPFEPS